MDGGAVLPKSLSERVLLRKNIFVEGERNQMEGEGDQDQLPEEGKMDDVVDAPRGVEYKKQEGQKYRPPEHDLMDTYDEYEEIEIKRSRESSKDANQENAERVLQMLKQGRDMEKIGVNQYTEDDEDNQMLDNIKLSNVNMDMGGADKHMMVGMNHNLDESHDLIDDEIDDGYDDDDFQ